MKESLSLENIKKLDKSGMLGVLSDFPQQCRQAYSIAQSSKVLFKNNGFKRIVFAGVGGSAIGADLVRSYLYFESSVPIAVVREYDLPAYVDSATLVFVSSYSGNTEETLNAYKQAKEKGASVIVISSGGKLKESALSDSVTFIEIPKGLPPRCALGFLSIIPLCLLSKLGIAKDVELSVNQTVRVLEELKDDNLNPHIGNKDNIAKHIAAKLYNKFTVVYSSSIYFDVVATRFKGQLNENSKALASAQVFPEVCHNEIMGWQNPAKLLNNCAAVIFRDKDMPSRITKRMDIVKEMLTKDGVVNLDVWSRGEGLLSRIFSLIYIGDFASFYLAILYGVDPAPADRITYIKNRL